LRQKIKRLLSLLLKTGITIGVIYWIISKFGWEKISSTISHADPLWITGGVILFVISILLGALQWRILLQNRGLDLPLGKMISLYFTGMFFNNFMLGMVAGDSYKVAHLHFNEGKAKSGFAATFYDRIAGLLVISIFALAGGIWLFFKGTTAIGEKLGSGSRSAAHKTLPLPCKIRVTNLENGRSAVLRVNDRGPFIGDRILDVTTPVAKDLGFYRKGLARVRIEVLSVGDGKYRID